MRTNLLYILIFLIGFSAVAQDQQLANQYFRDGKFEKAAAVYKELYDSKKHSTHYFKNLLKCWYALQEFEKAENLIAARFKTHPKQAFLWVELGYANQLQHKDSLANIYYEKAALALQKKPSSGYTIAKSFYDNHLLDYALDAYQLMIKEVPSANYNYQIAAIYGELGDIEAMFDTYLDMITHRGGKITNIQRFIGRYVTSDSQDANNIIFRKLLIKRLQEDPQDEWNQLLSWLYIQQKEYAKALRQEKAVHKRSNITLDGIINVGKIAFEALDFVTSTYAFDYVVANTSDRELQLFAHYFLLESDRKINTNKINVALHYEKILEEYGLGNISHEIQVSYADFLTFDMNNPAQAIEVLNASLENRLTPYQKAKVKIQLGDIMVFTGKYNQALILFSQVQTKLKNHPLAQEARYKVARTSYFRGDFDWANIQLKVLKRGTTKLIANDALDLSLLIDDNIAQDSVRTALKSYAMAELLSYQNKNQEAIDTLAQVLIKHKGHPIEDEALFAQAKLYETLDQYDLAAQNYLKIIDLKENDILIDDALYHLAQCYDNELNQPEKAKIYYEKIVFEQGSSIYLVTARKRYRLLRGDELVP